MRVLVTGGGSFIGRHLIRNLSFSEMEVTATVRRGKLEASPRVRVVRIDLADRTALPSLGATDAIVHCAAALPVGNAGAADFVRDNIVATMNLVQFAAERGIERMIMCSSMSVYGDIDVDVVDHLTSSRAPKPYGMSKLAAEQIAASQVGQLSTVALRLPGVIGQHAHNAFVVSSLNSIRRGEEIRLTNPDAPFNNVVHVDDLCLFIVALLGGKWSGFHAFPLGADGTVTIRQVAEILAQNCGRKPQIRIDAAKQQSFCIDNSYACGMGYRPRHIRQALAEYAAAECASW